LKLAKLVREQPDEMVCPSQCLVCIYTLLIIDTGGHLKPDPYNRPANLLATYGIGAAAEAAEFEAKNLAAVKNAIEKEGVDCDFVYTRAVDALMSDDILNKIKSGVDALRQKGVSVMQDVYFAQGAEAEQVSNIRLLLDP
jgi:hypothetical protein